MPLTKVRNQGLSFTSGVRNLIINGAMQVAQRGTDFNDVANGTYTVDRYKLGKENTDEAVINIDQTTTAPNGFSNSLKISVGTAESALAADELLVLQQLVEAQNLQHLQNGSSGAVSVTLSFWVRSSKTGTYTAAIRKPDNTDRNQSKEYTISSADTWEHKTLTFSGDTSGGGIANDNGAGFFIDWWLAGGSNFTGGTMDVWANTAAQRLSTNQVNLMDSTSNDWYITGVQLEVGDSASNFEHRSYGDELTRCMRYFERIGGYDYAFIANGRQRSATQSNIGVVFKATKRANPTESLSNIIVTDRLTFNASVTSDSEYKPTLYGASIRYDHSSYGSANNPILVTGNSAATGYIDFDSEL